MDGYHDLLAAGGNPRTNWVGKMKTEKTKSIELALLALTAVVVLFNFVQIGQMNGSGSLIFARAAGNGIIPTGVPKIYGSELGISFDDVSPYDMQKADQTIAVLKNIDKTVELSGANLERYINILYHMNNGISCEYCCGAKAVIFEDGKAACGCAHSYAMRGLTKYLITEHGDEYTDEEIFEEVGKWKVLFFPDIMQGKADIMEQQGIDIDYLTLTSNMYRGVEKGQAAGSMVGGC